MYQVQLTGQKYFAILVNYKWGLHLKQTSWDMILYYCLYEYVSSAMVWVHLPLPPRGDMLQGWLHVQGHQRSPKTQIECGEQQHYLQYTPIQ